MDELASRRPAAWLFRAFWVAGPAKQLARSAGRRVISGIILVAGAAPIEYGSFQKGRKDTGNYVPAQIFSALVRLFNALVYILCGFAIWANADLASDLFC